MKHATSTHGFTLSADEADLVSHALLLAYARVLETEHNADSAVSDSLLRTLKRYRTDFDRLRQRIERRGGR